MNIRGILKAAEKGAIDNSPLILTSLGAAGVVTTAVLTGRATIKATRLIDSDEDGFPFSPSDKIKASYVVKKTWKLFIPPAGSAIFTIGCVVAANRVGTRRAAAIAAAYTLSERAFEEYREKIVEKIGANKEQAARDEIAQDRVTRNPISSSQIILTDNGEVPFYDVYTGRYFKSTVEAIKKAQNDLNHRILSDGYASLNDFYSWIELPHIPSGEEVGWSSDKLLDIYFATTMTDDQKPCVSIEFYVQPMRNYFRVH